MASETNEDRIERENNSLPGLTFCLLVKNEEKNLQELLPQLSRLNFDIIIADTGSTDRTSLMAQQNSARFIEIPWSGDFSSVRNIMLDSVDSEWIFMIDADERLTAELEQEIIDLVKQNNTKNGYYVPRRNHYFRKWLKHGGQYPDYQLKMFRKKSAEYEKVVHEKIIIDGGIGYMQNHILHYSYVNMSHYLSKFDLYTDLEAKLLQQEGIQANTINAIRWIFIKPFIRFCKRYFLKVGFFDGIPGLFACVFDALGYPARFFKLWELQNNKKYQ